MTTTFLFVRHAAHDDVGGFLAGRMPGVRLGAAGRAQAARLAERLRREEFDTIHSSPRERTTETAQAISAATAARVETAPDLDEVDFGPWSGRGFDELDADPLWRQWNGARSLTRTPGGETMHDVQARVLRLMERLSAKHPERTIVLVSHAEVIKAAVSFHLGLPIDAWQKFDIAPASITKLAVGEAGAKLLGLNEVVS
ncbi:MAG: histidine phosphatase family protein [Methylobacteriaceae bacterium]|nr:histidine phosphatase family protein [Methylobacteriaceae bacterium]